MVLMNKVDQYRQYIQLFIGFDAGELWNLSSTQQCPPCGHPYQLHLFNLPPAI